MSAVLSSQIWWAVPQRALALLVSVGLFLSMGAAGALPRPEAVGEAVTVIVRELKPSDTPERAVERLGGTVTHQLPLVDGFAAEVPAGNVAALRRTAGVREITPNYPVQFQGQYGEGSGTASAVYTDVVRAGPVWNKGTDGAGVTVAVIDTGIDAGHPDLTNKVVASVDLSHDQDGKDNFGHGTFIAGLIAGTGAASKGAVKGVAPGAKLAAVKVGGRDGSTDLVRVLAGLQWTVWNQHLYGIRVVNLSLGTDSIKSTLTDPLNMAVERTWLSGLVVVTSAGNRGPGARTITKPGDDPFVITVGSFDDKTTVVRSDDTIPAFSSIGPTAADGLAKPDFVAPGKSVVAARAVGSTIDASFPTSRVGDAYFRASGTSFSTAIASGAAALVVAKTPVLVPNQVKHRLMSETKAAAASTDPNVVGKGQLDAFGATFSTSILSANLNLTVSTGTGSLQDSRGSYCLRTEDNSRCLTDSEADAITGFDASQWAASQWSASQWAASQWAASQWAASQWAASQWAASQWAASQWAASQWAASQWAASQWAASQWAASQWAASQWAASQWSSASWD
jgi:serine protease AprX